MCRQKWRKYSYLSMVSHNRTRRFSYVYYFGIFPEFSTSSSPTFVSSIGRNVHARLEVSRFSTIASTSCASRCCRVFILAGSGVQSGQDERRRVRVSIANRGVRAVYFRHRGRGRAGNSGKRRHARTGHDNSNLAIRTHTCPAVKRQFSLSPLPPLHQQGILLRHVLHARAQFEWRQRWLHRE